MLKLLIGFFIVMHGLIHLLYFALSGKLVEINNPVVGWPERSWVFSHLLGVSAIRLLASALYIAATVLFIVSGAGVLFSANWWQPVLLGSAAYSSAVVILFWDGKTQQLPEKGFVGVLINIAVAGAVLLLNALAILL